MNRKKCNYPEMVKHDVATLPTQKCETHIFMKDTGKLTVKQFQQQIYDIYFTRDSARGADGTFRWLVEETGELARAMREGKKPGLEEEFGDVFAWLVSLASILGIDMEHAAAKYKGGCPKCCGIPCKCPE